MEVVRKSIGLMVVISFVLLLFSFLTAQPEKTWDVYPSNKIFDFPIEYSIAGTEKEKSLPIISSSLGASGIELKITSPTSGAIVRDIVPITANVTGEIAPAFLVFYIDDLSVCSTNCLPYKFEWDTREYSDGEHILRVDAYLDGTKIASSKRVKVTVANKLKYRSQEYKFKGKELYRQARELTKGSLESEAYSYPSYWAPVVARRKLKPETGKVVDTFPRIGAPLSVSVSRVKPVPSYWIPVIAKEEYEAEREAIQPPEGEKPTSRSVPESGIPEGEKVPSYWMPVIILKKVKAPPEKVFIASSVSEPGISKIATSEPAEKAGELPIVQSLSRQPRPKSGEILVVYKSNPLRLKIAPTIIKGKTLVGLREVFEQLGATVDWVAKTKTVIAIRGLRRIQLRIGCPEAQVNGETVSLSFLPSLRNGRTIIPLRFCEEAFKFNVEWITRGRFVALLK